MVGDVLLPLSCCSLLNHFAPLQLNKDIKLIKATTEFFFCLLLEVTFYLFLLFKHSCTLLLLTHLHKEGR